MSLDSSSTQNSLGTSPPFLKGDIPFCKKRMCTGFPDTSSFPYMLYKVGFLTQLLSF